MEEFTRTSADESVEVTVHNLCSALLETPRYRVMRLIAQVSEITGIHMNDIMGPYRDVPFVHARHIAMYAVRKRMHWAYARIGRHFSRDHSTVHHAIMKITANPQDYPELEALGLKGN